MTGTAEADTNTAFVIGQHYTFTQPVEADCCSCDGGPWGKKTFAEGWCFGYDGKKRSYTFRGSPVDEGVDSLHFFLI
ncbi:hypothetical protein KW800_01695 [Candidatus Parcubacteria bacterium]|nr:hypothetical protein [Candidatus Parcubacteria bacterium]